MFSRLTFSERIQAALGLAMVCLLIFATNRLDKMHFERVQGTLTSVFDDRVVAQDLIFKLSREFNEKTMRLASGTRTSPDPENKRIELLLTEFAATKLTKKEQALFDRLRADFARVSGLEKRHPSEENNQKLESALTAVGVDLKGLAAVQVDESRRLIRSAQMSLDSTLFHSKIQIGILAFLGLMMQLLILVKPWE